MRPETKTWNLVTVRLSRDAEELALSVLFDLGTVGTVTFEETPDALEIGAYFNPEVSPDRVLSELKKRLGEAHLIASLHSAQFNQVHDEDWLRKWKEGFEAVAVGERLLIAPSWKVDDLLNEDSSQQMLDERRQEGGRRRIRGRFLIQIDPGMAFGTGTHETTRLCLEAIERYWMGGRFLDVGTGTGILAMAAALLVPGSEIVAIDVDPVAVEIAKQNLVMNQLTGVTVTQCQPGMLGPDRFDVLVANLTAGVIADLLDTLTAAVKPDGRLILSGILSDQAEDIAVALDRTGFAIIERIDAGEWVCLVSRSLYR